MKLATKKLGFEIRAGTVDDVPLLLSFIHLMAEFEKLEVTATVESLEEALFGERPSAHVLFAFVDDAPAAYVVYFFTFATMVGKRGLWLDDLFVIPEFRGQGIAAALMAYLAEIAIQNNCARFEWMVLDWNKTAIDFYLGMEASVLKDWKICRIEEWKLARVANRLVKKDQGG